MLSPFINALRKNYVDVDIHIITEYKHFLNFKDVSWVHPNNIDYNNLQNSLLISPTLSWRHLKFLHHFDEYIGYFLTNKMMSSFKCRDASYDLKNDHYYVRAKNILNELGLVDDANEFPEPIFEDISNFDLSLKEYICAAPFSNWEERQYPEDKYIELIDQLSETHTVVMVGGKSAQEMELATRIKSKVQKNNVINLVGQTTLGEVASFIGRSKLFIGNDSGLSHLAYLCKVPVVTVFGCVPGDLRTAINSNLSSELVLSCGSGYRCSKFPCYDGLNKPFCTNKDQYACLNYVSKQEILNGVEELLKSKEI